jgi:uncharacterized protein (DUF885 family)
VPGLAAATAVLPLLAMLALGGCDRAPPDGDRPAAGSAAASRAAAAEGQRLREITDAYHEAWLALDPLAATAQGDHRYDDRLGNHASPAWMADWLAIEQEALARLATLEPAKLGGDDAVTYEAFRYGRESAIAGFRYPTELLAVDPFSGLHLQFAVLGSGAGSHPFRSVRDYENFLGRMDGFVAWTDQAIESLRTGAAKGVVLPRVLVERTVAQLAEMAVEDPGQSVFWQPVRDLPDAMPAAERKRLAQAYAERLGTRVLPAYRRLHDFLESEYLPQAREPVGWSELPNGVEWYAYLVRHHTTTTLTPDAIHRLGLEEVARIRGDMDRLRRALGHEGDLGSFLDALRADPLQYYADPAELVAGYRAIEQRVDAALPLLFASRPKGTLADGRRPGVSRVDTRDPGLHPKYAMEARYLREAVPGHQYQAALAQEATDLPRLRRVARDTAYAEGWASYAESLGRDLGLYADPYAAFGAVASAMVRAVRLVVDTGLHSQGWTRAQAIDYFRENTALGEADIIAEVDRHLARPGEALAGMIGERSILELRRRAQEQLGPRFDVREFHAQVLAGGSLPLPVLEAKIGRWIESQL